MCVCACDRCPGAILDDHQVKKATVFVFTHPVTCMISEPWPRLVADSHLMQSINRFLLSSTLSRSPWASLFNSPTLAGTARRCDWKPKSSLGQEKSRKSDWNGNRVGKCKKRKTGGRAWKIFKHVFFHVFPCFSTHRIIFPPLLLPLPMLCICVALTNQLSSPKSELSNGRQFQVKGRNGQPRHISPSQRTPVTSWKVTFSPKLHGNLWLPADPPGLAKAGQSCPGRSRGPLTKGTKEGNVDQTTNFCNWSHIAGYITKLIDIMVIIMVM